MARLVGTILDELPLTERAYHHLSYGAPLVEEILLRVQAAAPSGRVLMIGGNALLGHALLRLGYDTEIWTVRGAYLTDALQPYVRRLTTPEELAAGAAGLSGAGYAVIILPLFLEGLPGPPDALLAGLRRGLRADGRLILATANVARLDLRLAALAGKNAVPSTGAAPAMSLSWPALPGARPYHRDDLVVLCRRAGFQIRECRFVTAFRPFMEMDSFGVVAYGLRHLAHALQRVIVSSRDVLLLDLGRRIADEAPAAERAGDSGAGRPTVSVVVSAAGAGGPAALREALGSLLEQTYPRDAYEVLVIHTGESAATRELIGEVAADRPGVVRELVVPEGEGPRARNRAMAEATGIICAHTDGACRLPADWIQTAVPWLDERTAAVSGPVVPVGDSPPRYLDPPGSRPDPDDKGVSPRVLFSIANVFYRRSVALAAGGFDESFAGGETGPRLGWDTELAWRIRRLGWETRFREEVYAFRVFPWPARFRWIPEQWRKAEDLPRLAAAIPEVAEELLTLRYFASNQTMYFDLLIGGLVAALARRRCAWLLLGTPWLASIGQRLDFWPPQQWAFSLRMLVRRGARHLIWTGALLGGSVKARRLVL